MNEQEMIEAILTAIQDAYNKKYVGTIRVKHIEPIGWRVRLGIRNDDKPVEVCAELPDNKFIKYFIKELHTRNWNCTKWFTGYKTYPLNYIK